MKHATLPPGPSWPVPLQTLAWATRTIPFLEGNRRRFGDTFTVRIANEPTWVMLGDPDAIRDVFTGDPQVLRAGEGNKILEPLVGSRSVLILDGREHLGQRKLLLPPFHGERLAAQRSLMEAVAEEEIASWPAGERFAAQPRMQAMTLEIIVRVVLGVERDDARAGALRDALARLLAVVMKPAFLLPVFLMGPHVERLPMLRRIFDHVDDQLRSLIADRRAAPDLEQRSDVLSMLAAARHEDGSPMSDDELRDELVTLLVAGHETTATALSWALERLLRHPEALARLQDGDEAWADAVVKETLRLRPPIPIVVRKLAEPFSVAGHDLPAGVAVTPCMHLVHRNPRIYPEPHAFRPERFLGVKPGTYTWLPFGGGVRRCLGAAFAEQEMRVVLLALVRTRRLRVTTDAPERVVRRTIVMAPSRGGELVADPAA